MSLGLREQTISQSGAVGVSVLRHFGWCDRMAPRKKMDTSALTLLCSSCTLHLSKCDDKRALLDCHRHLSLLFDILCNYRFVTAKTRPAQLVNYQTNCYQLDTYGCQSLQ
ncbi:UNVERIFIED_CONTAM: hypothetical protein K2H54_063484 [Gekko kuhli]